MYNFELPNGLIYLEFLLPLKEMFLKSSTNRCVWNSNRVAQCVISSKYLYTKSLLGLLYCCVERRCSSDFRIHGSTYSRVGNSQPVGHMRPAKNSYGPTRPPKEKNNMDEYYVHLARDHNKEGSFLACGGKKAAHHWHTV